MTTHELIEIIAKSDSAQWFNSVESNINYPHIDYSQNFVGIPSVHKFLTEQINGWKKVENLPSELAASLKHFERLKTELESFVNTSKDQHENTLNSNWPNQRNKIEKNTPNSPFFTYASPEAMFLINVYENYPDSFQGAYHYIIGQLRTNNKGDFIGTLLAYEFELKDHTKILTRRDAEKASISKIRNNFQNQLNESQTELTRHLTDTNKKYKSYAKKIDDIKAEKEKLFDEWYENTQKAFSLFNEKSNSKISELEETYTEKLKLEKPAKYWSSKSTKYYKDAKSVRMIILVLVGISAVFLSSILAFSPDWIFKYVFKGNATAVIRWSIVFITLLSLLAYAIRALTKVMFSSYHLARDAEERHTLTFFYLALLKDSTVNDEDRKLILQSLFSRVDTGLLKDDSGPTMPNDAIGKILGKVNKQ